MTERVFFLILRQKSFAFMTKKQFFVKKKSKKLFPFFEVVENESKISR